MGVVKNLYHEDLQNKEEGKLNLFSSWRKRTAVSQSMWVFFYLKDSLKT